MKTSRIILFLTMICCLLAAAWLFIHFPAHSYRYVVAAWLLLMMGGCLLLSFTTKN